MKMREFEERLKKIEYHQKLLLEMIKNQTFPLYELLIRKDLSEEEVDELFTLCDMLNEKLAQQKEEGFVYFTPLLTEFVGMLNRKLHPEETINAFLMQDMYPTLMGILKKTLESVQE